MRICFLHGFSAGLQTYRITFTVLEMLLFTYQCLFDPDCLKIHKYSVKYMQGKNKFRISE